MIGQTISHYPALWDSATGRDSGKRNKILEKLRPKDGGQVGEVPKSSTSVLHRVVATLRIPLKRSESGSGIL